MNTPLIERARNLFEFLQRAQELKTTSPRTTESYGRDGAVLWLADSPKHPAVAVAHRGGDPAPDDPLLTVDRVARADPPAPDAELARWVTEPLDDPERPPSLRDAITVVEDADDVAQDGDTAGQVAPPPRTRRLGDAPEIHDRYRVWIGDWQVWAEQELRDRPVRDFYNELFSAYVKATGSPEDLELVAGMGCLAWEPDNHPPVKRHLFTSPVTITFDDDTARLSVHRVESAEVLKVELDMLDPGLITTPDKVNEVRADARELEAHPLHRDEVGALARRLVHILDADGEYREHDEASNPARNAVATFAPAVILRKRSQRGLVEIFQTIVDQLAGAEHVPDGVVPLVDADHMPRAPDRAGQGAMITVDDEPFLPMPINDKQRQIIERVDTKAQVLVQGPPGTGKTHTAGALLSHLLAQGKRVLVTAHTDRALREVRDKLPEDIKPLSVSVVGHSREDMADLKVAVQTIATAAHEHDTEDNARAIQDCYDAIDRLRRQRADLHSQLLAAREREVREHEHAGYHGTLAAIARDIEAGAERYGWLLDHVTVTAGDEPPLRSDEIVEWRRHLLDGGLAADESEARTRLLDLDTLPDPNRFADLVSAEHRAATDRDRHEQLTSHSAFDAVLRLDEEQRSQVQRRLHDLAEEADNLAGRREQWMDDALLDVRSGRASEWRARGEKVAELIHWATRPVEWLGPLIEVELPPESGDRLAALAREVRKHLDGGGKIKTAPDGSPKLGTFTSKVLKHAQPLFDTVRVDGLPPTTPRQLDTVMAWADASKALSALDRAWPDNVHVPAEDTFHERLQWHRTELEQLRRVLELADALEAEEQRLDDLALPSPDWDDLQAVRTYARLVDAAAAQEAWADAAHPLRRLEDVAGEAARWADAAPCVGRLSAAVTARDRDEYAAAYGRLERMWRVRDLVARRDELESRLEAGAPSLSRAIAADPSDDEWSRRLARFVEAWAWASTRSWVLGQESTDVNAMQDGIATTDGHIREQVESLAARRAWDYAASPQRLSGTARADLTQYAQLVDRAGKLTGQYAAQRKAEIRRAMDRCRPSVPVWIMPIYRIAEQLRIKPDMFDVVIVDEASQAGMESTFLQYLAAKIVVIGDDKQVSPAAVGVDQGQLRDLAGQYLTHDRYRDSWQDPKRSLFDEGKMRYGGLITLTEHRRSVPEIIGFSNRIAYERDNIRLVPVRQYGADRLEPIKAVYLPEGYERGSTNKINPVEVDAIVEQVEKCLADPAYTGKTFGVISLLGPAQAKRIQNKLMERIPGFEWSGRDLRCGDAADFQGSERDVMFLSMVAAPEPGRRLAALTQNLHVQRYNVAVSRAKDQAWVFHSIDLQELSNQEDMRFHLLDYCYGVMSRGQSVAEEGSRELVPEDRAVPPFDSLFEQRVYNRIVDHGYTVIPQYEAAGYRIDLVVLGGNTRLAVECDGDHWHGPDAFERDLARQRELGRCGWRFFRIRESEFYLDPAAALHELWGALRDLDIHPAGAWADPSPHDVDELPSAAAGPEPTAPAALESTRSSAYAVVETDQVISDGTRQYNATPTEPAGAGEHPTPPRPARTDETERTTSVRADPVPAAPEVTQGPAPPSELAEQAGPPRLSKSPLEPYEEFSGWLTPVSDATRSQLVDGIRQIVAVEGPMLGDRLHGVYVRASGGQRVGKQIATTLNSAIDSAERRGVLVADDPLGRPDVKPRTYRLPEQPAVRARQHGPRTLDQVPPSELAAIMVLAGRDYGWEEGEAILRATLDLLGVRRFTTQIRERLEPVLALARSQYRS